MKNYTVNRIIQETVDYKSCLWLYDNGFFGNDDVDIIKNGGYTIVSKRRDTIYAAPRWFDVLLWLNKEKKCVFYPCHHREDGGWWTCYFYRDSPIGFDMFSTDEFGKSETYELALKRGILYLMNRFEKIDQQ